LKPWFKFVQCFSFLSRLFRILSFGLSDLIRRSTRVWRG
jgi:hypothetical protein